MSVDRPKSAEKLLVKFINMPPEYDDGFKTVYDEPGGDILDQVTYISVWNACDNYEEVWFRDDNGTSHGYALTLTTSTGDHYSVRWARATHDRGGLRLPAPGPWRFRGGGDHWGNDNMTLANVEFRTARRPEKETA